MTLPGIGILTTGTANKKLLSNTFINSQKKILEIRKSPTLSKTISDLDILCWNEMKFKPSLSWYLFGIHFFLFFVRPPLYITLISWWKTGKGSSGYEVHLLPFSQKISDIYISALKRKLFFFRFSVPQNIGKIYCFLVSEIVDLAVGKFKSSLRLIRSRSIFL